MMTRVIANLGRYRTAEWWMWQEKYRTDDYIL